MLLALMSILARSEDRSRGRRPRRCILSLLESGWCLEDRVLPSAMGVRAQAVEVAQNPANTRAGQEVSHMFESILQTNPTAAQLTQLVHRLRGGLSVAALRKDLTAEARAQQGMTARSPMDVMSRISGPSASAGASMRSSAAGTMSPVSMMPGPSASTTTMSPTPITIGMGPSSGMSMSSDGSMGPIAMTPAGAGMVTMMTVIPQPVAPLTFTSMTMNALM